MVLGLFISDFLACFFGCLIGLFIETFQAPYSSTFTVDSSSSAVCRVVGSSIVVELVL